MHLIDPYPEPGVREFLSLGKGAATAVIPGPHSPVAITAAKPTLYLRGFPASSGIALVRQMPKSDYRELKNGDEPDYEEWIHFRKQDLRAVDLAPAGPGVVRCRRKKISRRASMRW